MPRYHFHATDGYSVVLDSPGRRLDVGEMETVAADVAEGVRQRFGLLADLRDWLVVVQDDVGFQVAVFAFEELPAVAEFEALAA